MGYSSIQTHITEAIPSFFDSIHQSSSSFKCFFQMSTMTHCAQVFTCFIINLNKALPHSEWQTNSTTFCNLTASNQDTNSQLISYPLHSLPCSSQLTSNSFRSSVIQGSANHCSHDHLAQHCLNVMNLHHCVQLLHQHPPSFHS